MSLRTPRWLRAGLLFLVFTGCGRQETKAPPGPPVAPPVAPGVVLGEPAPRPAPDPVATPPKIAGVEGAFEAPPLFATQVDPNSEKYDTALAEALTHLADRKYEQALESFESARAFKDTEFVRGEIAKIKSRVEQDTAAEKTVADIEAVLEQGKAPEAAQLLTKALGEFGDRDVSERLVALRVQADALQAVTAGEDEAGRARRLREEGQAALREQNLRAAALAFEQSLQFRDDPALRDDLVGVRERLRGYDGFRKKAAELRRDPQRLEEAIDLLREAAKAWDTLQVRQDLDEYSLALERRRDTISVADFEVGADLGFGDAGRVVAEELLTHFKSRFDLIERAQIAKVLQELNLERSFADDPEQQREVANVAKVRYLVLGSVRRLGSVIVQARLVDARTGLVVQTARITAPTVEGILNRLPDLARHLQMSDEEKLALEQEQVQAARRIEPVPVNEPLPPPPAQEPMPVQPAALFEAAPPPPVVGVTVRQFQALPPPPATQLVMIAEPPPPPLRHKVLFASLQMGDNFFRMGQYREAQRHFDFALTLAPNDFDIHLRLERVRPLLPPPVVQTVIVATPAPIILRPRIAFINFLVVGDPRIVPPSLSTWTPAHLAPYFRGRYEIVDPNEVYWMMGRMGLGVGDLMNDPHARRWLGRALGVQTFVLGTIEQTASFNVNTYLMNAEHGYVQGSARMHVHNPFELKLRLGELAQISQLPPDRRALYIADDNRFEVMLGRGRDELGRRNFAVSIRAFEDALQVRPGNLQVMVYLNQARAAQRQWELEEARRQDFLRRQALAEAARRRQWDISQAAESLRIQFAGPNVAVGIGVRDTRQQAYGDLVTKARVAVKAGNFTLGVSFFKGALDLVPPPAPAIGLAPPPPGLLVSHDVVLNELAHARAEADRADRQRKVAESVAAREAALRQQREKELAVARERIAEERRKAEAQQLAQKQLTDTKYQAAFDQGQLLMSQGKYEAAIVALQGARQLKKTPAVDALLQTALDRQAQQTAKNDNDRDALQARLDASRKRARAAEEEAKQNRALYEQALRDGQTALAAKNYDVAETQFTTASKYFKTDAALGGLRQVSTARAAVKADQDRGQRLARLLADGNAAFAAGNLADSVDKLKKARDLEPANVEVIAALSRAEQAQARLKSVEVRKIADAERDKNYQRLLASGKANLEAKQYAAAVASLTEAVKQRPNDPAAQAALSQAQKAAAAQGTKEDLAQKTQQYQKLIGEGRAAMAGKRYDDAIAAFQGAQKILPGDKTSAEFLEDARDARAEAQQTAKKAALAKVAVLQRQKDFQAALAEGRKLLDADNYAAARQALERAKQLSPGDAAVAAALTELNREEQQAKSRALIEAKSQQQFQALVDSGRTALAAKKYEEAAKTFQTAAALRPADALVKSLLQQAQQGMNASAAADMRVRLQASLTAGRAALATSDFAKAAASFSTARDLAPNDPDVAQALRDLQTAVSAASKKGKAFDEALAEGRRALGIKNYEAAIQKANEALKLQPKSAEATLLLNQASQAKTQAAAAQATQIAEQNRNRYQTLLDEGQRHLREREYREAIAPLQAAVKLFPSDPVASTLLKQAQQGAEGDQAAELKKKAAFADVLQTGQRLMAQKKYAEALQALQAGRALYPSDPQVGKLIAQANQGLAASKEVPQPKPAPPEPKVKLKPPTNDPPKKAAEPPKKAVEAPPKKEDAKARYAKHLQEGQRDLQARRFDEAIREFEAALQAVPGDPAATQLLQKARNKGK